MKHADTARKLAAYLERMPVELRGMFADEFQHINRAELAQLRAESQRRLEDLQAIEKKYISLRAELAAAQAECDEAKAWHVSLNAMIERKNITIAQQAAQLEGARKAIECARITLYKGSSAKMFLDDWLTANAQPQEQAE